MVHVLIQSAIVWLHTTHPPHAMAVISSNTPFLMFSPFRYIIFVMCVTTLIATNQIVVLNFSLRSPSTHTMSQTIKHVCISNTTLRPNHQARMYIKHHTTPKPSSTYVYQTFTPCPKPSSTYVYQTDIKTNHTHARTRACARTHTHTHTCHKTRI